MAAEEEIEVLFHPLFEYAEDVEQVLLAPMRELEKSPFFLKRMAGGENVLQLDPRCEPWLLQALLENTPPLLFQEDRRTLKQRAETMIRQMAEFMEEYGEVPVITNAWALMVQLGLVHRDDWVDSPSESSWTRAVESVFSSYVDLALILMKEKRKWEEFEATMRQLYQMDFYTDGENIAYSDEVPASQVLNIFTAYHGIGFLDGMKLSLLSHFWEGVVEYRRAEDGALLPFGDILRTEKWWMELGGEGTITADIPIMGAGEENQLFPLVPQVNVAAEKARSINAFMSPLAAFNQLFFLVTLKTGGDFMQPSVTDGTVRHGVGDVLSWRTNPLGFRMREALASRDPVVREMAAQVDAGNRVSE